MKGNDHQKAGTPYLDNCKRFFGFSGKEVYLLAFVSLSHRNRQQSFSFFRFEFKSWNRLAKLPSKSSNQSNVKHSFERQQLFRNILSQSCHPLSLSSRDLNLSMDLSLAPFASLAPMLCSLTAPNLYSEPYQNSYSTQSFLVWKDQKETHPAKSSKEISTTRGTTTGSFNTARVKHQSLPQFETELLDMKGQNINHSCCNVDSILKWPLLPKSWYYFIEKVASLCFPEASPLSASVRFFSPFPPTTFFFVHF